MTMTTPMDLPADVFVGILLRLPPSFRRLTRLVCRQWRDLVDTSTAEMQSRAKPLVAAAEGSAYIVDDPSTGSHRYLWKDDALPYRGTMIVGTCNGLICLCDNRPKPDGAVTLVNPVTGERLSLPPLPWGMARDYAASPHTKYGFAYDPTTGRHKVVHVAAYGTKGDPQVKVFTLGEASWRYVATAPGPRCDYRAGIVAVDGAVYWAGKSCKKLMAFDLGKERLTFIKSLPYVSSDDSWFLDGVQGRLGMLLFHSEAQKCEVWVLEGAKTMSEHKWSCLYIVRRHIPQHSSSRVWHITWNVVNKHKPSNDSSVAKTSDKSPGMMVCMKACGCYHRRTFAYVETTEPLNIYRCWS